MKQPKKNSKGYMRCNYQNLTYIATSKDEVIVETSILNLRSANGSTTEAFAGDVQFNQYYA